MPRFESVDVGMQVPVEGGFLSPVVRDADRKVCLFSGGRCWRHTISAEPDPMYSNCCCANANVTLITHFAHHVRVQGLVEIARETADLMTRVQESQLTADQTMVCAHAFLPDFFFCGDMLLCTLPFVIVSC